MSSALSAVQNQCTVLPRVYTNGPEGDGNPSGRRTVPGRLASHPVRSAEFVPFGQQLFGVRQHLSRRRGARSKAAKRRSICSKRFSNSSSVTTLGSSTHMFVVHEWVNLFGIR
jgi:hypothetical protein